MALQGAFVADFASFTAACAKAEVSLKGFESGSGKVEASLNRMASSFSGTKIIQDATQMARIFADAGGAATFTTAQLRRMGAVGEEAFEKLRKTGAPIPENLRAMVKATRDLGDAKLTTAGKMDKFALSVGQADALLGRFGVNLPPSVRGLADLANIAVTAKLGVAGMGAAAVPAAAGAAAVGTGSAAAAGGMALLAPAALVVGTALASWKLGSVIGEVSGLTDAIADGTAKLLGWGDVAAQEAGAKADVLALASMHAGRQITDLSEAIAINVTHLAKMRDAANAAAAGVDALAQATMTEAEAAVYAEGVRINNEAQLATLAEQFGHTAAQTDTLTRETEALTEATDVWRSSATFTTEVVGDLIPVIDDMAGKVRTLSGEMVDAAEYALNQLRGGQVALNEFSAAQFEAAGGAAKLAEIEESYRRNPGRRAGAGGDTGVGANDAAGYAAMLAEQQLYAQLLRYRPVAIPPSLAPDPPAAVLTGPATRQPGGGGGGRRGGGATINTTIHVNGTAEDLARKIGEEITRLVRRGTLLSH